MTKLEEIEIGVSPFGNVYIGKMNKAKSEFIGDKKEITNEFIQSVISKFGPNHSTKVTVAGEHTHNVLVLPADKKVITDIPTPDEIKQLEDLSNVVGEDLVGYGGLLMNLTLVIQKLKKNS